MPIERTADVEKEKLRAHFVRLRGALEQVDRQKKSQKLADHFLHFVMAFQNERMRTEHKDRVLTIGLYSAFRKEADLSETILRLQALGHTVVYPKTDMQSKGLTFFRVFRTEELIVGNYGIYEPAGTTDMMVVPDEIDVVCVPGLAFTRNGIRLGYGGGYYDRFFAYMNKPVLRVGTAYGVQVAQTLPSFRHDVRMDYLLTEEGWMACQP